MAVNSVAPSNTAIQATPPRQPEPVKVDQPAEQIKPAPPPPPPQAATAPSVNTSGQRIGTTISTSA